MASFASESLVQTCLFMFRFKTIPLTRNIDIAQSFKSSAADDATKSYLQILTSTRENVFRELSNLQSLSASRIVCLDNYIPIIFQLLESLNRSESDVFLDRRLVFEWRGGLNSTDVWNSYEEVIFDIIMALHTKSFIHYKYATELLAVELNAEVFVQAGKQFRLAAGIMFFLQSMLIPKWVSSRGRVGTPPESSEPLCAAMGHMFTAAAQVMAVVKAMQDSTPPAVMAKLSFAVVKEFETTIDILIRQISQEHQSKIPFSELTTYLAIMREFYQGLVYKYQAESLADTGEAGIGVAIALCVRGQARLQEQAMGKVYLVEEPGLPRQKDMPPLVLAGVAEIRSSLGAIERRLRRENDLIYHVLVPGQKDPLPEGQAVLIMRPEPFVQLETPLIAFKYEKVEVPAPPTTSSSILSFFTGKRP